MLELDVAPIHNSDAAWDPEREIFVDIPDSPGGHLCLEHSLISISKWESKYHRPFLAEKPEKTDEEVMDYIKCMTINKVPDDIYQSLTKEHLKQINDYIGDPMSATKFASTRKQEGRGRYANGSENTSEVIYYNMFALGIPIDCEKWHIARLLTLIRVFSVKNQTQKMSGKELARNNRSLNAARRAKHHSKG